MSTSSPWEEGVELTLLRMLTRSLGLSGCHPSTFRFISAAFVSCQNTAMQQNVNSREGCGSLTRAALVMFRSFITSSNAAVSSACFWLCKAIFSLNLRGLLEDAIFPSSSQWNVTLHTTLGPCAYVITQGQRQESGGSMGSAIRTYPNVHI